MQRPLAGAPATGLDDSRLASRHHAITGRAAGARGGEHDRALLVTHGAHGGRHPDPGGAPAAPSVRSTGHSPTSGGGSPLAGSGDAPGGPRLAPRTGGAATQN